jgi:hypothetical protein
MEKYNCYKYPNKFNRSELVVNLNRNVEYKCKLGVFDFIFTNTDQNFDEY